MSLDDEFNTYKGKGVLVPGQKEIYRGQCFQWFDFVLHDVYGLPYFYAPDAVNIWQNKGNYNLGQYFNFIAYNPTMPIKKGDFVIYGPGVGSPSGHVSIALQDGQGNNYLGADTNWGHNLTVHAQPHNDTYNQYILGVLRLKGDNMPDNGIPTSTQVGQLYPVLVGRNPTQDELNLAVGLNWFDWLKYLLPGVQTLRNTVANLEKDRDTNLYPTINATTEALGLPVGASKDDIVNAINNLKKGGVSSVVINGTNYVPK